MKNYVGELETSFTKQLTEIIELQNQLEILVHEKNDQLKDFAIGIINVIDSIERIEESLKEREYDKNDIGSKIMKRYSLVSKLLINHLNKFGIEKINFPDNRLIVGYSRIVDTEPDESRDNDEIINIVRNGYIKGNYLIREADLIVVKN